MRRLVSSSEAAEILGLSLQGVHYRIKKGQIKSMKKDGKTYVYVDKEQIDDFHKNQNSSTQQAPKQNTTTSQTLSSEQLQNIPEQHRQLYELVYKAKDDQIKDLKENIESVKEQYKTEIYRLDKSQKQILEVFQGEVELLKSAFNEMKNVYQLEHKERMEDKKHQYEKTSNRGSEEYIQQEQEEVQSQTAAHKQDEIEIPFMDLKEFYAYMKGFKKTDAQIKNIILERVKAGDKRFIYKKGTKEVIIFKSDFMDLV